MGVPVGAGPRLGRPDWGLPEGHLGRCGWFALDLVSVRFYWWGLGWLGVLGFLRKVRGEVAPGMCLEL